MDFASEDEAVGAGEASAAAAGVAIATGGTARVPRVIERRISIIFFLSSMLADLVISMGEHADLGGVLVGTGPDGALPAAGHCWVRGFPEPWVSLLAVLPR
jgi:hypothetical protein